MRTAVRTRTRASDIHGASDPYGRLAIDVMHAAAGSRLEPLLTTVPCRLPSVC